MSTAKNLTNLQLELLKMFSYELPANQIAEIKSLLAKYFAEKATEEMDSLWEDKKWTDQTIEDWKEEHLRSKYD